MQFKISGEKYRQLLVALFGAAYKGIYRYLAFSSKDEKEMFRVLLNDADNLLEPEEKILFFESYGINKTGEPTIIPDVFQEEMIMKEVYNKLLKSNFVNLFKHHASGGNSKVTSGHSPETITEIIFETEEEILC